MHMYIYMQCIPFFFSRQHKGLLYLLTSFCSLLFFYLDYTVQNWSTVLSAENKRMGLYMPCDLCSTENKIKKETDKQTTTKKQKTKKKQKANKQKLEHVGQAE